MAISVTIIKPRMNPGNSIFLKDDKDRTEYDQIVAENRIIEFLDATMPFEVSKPVVLLPKQSRIGSFSHVPMDLSTTFLS